MRFQSFFRRESWAMPSTDFTERSGLTEGHPSTFRDVLKQERKYIENKQRAATLDGTKPGAPFSVAFSGGGIRAAAFQSGVLRRLAEEGLLKDVEYLAAVSGGGYIASSFCSHALAEPKEWGEKLDDWYRRVVAKCICRMQRNAGGFVRDFQGEAFNSPTDGSGLLPRAFDVPLLILCVLVTLLSNPIQGVLVFLVPVTEIVQLFFSSAMRGIFCAPDNVSQWYIFMKWSPMGTMMRILGIAVLLNLAIFLLKMMPCLDLKESQSTGPRSQRYLVVRGCLACLSRLSGIMALLIFLIVCVPNFELWMHRSAELSGSGTPSRQEICLAYMTTDGVGAHGGTLEHGEHVGSTCANFYNGVPWYQDKLFQDFANSAASTAANSSVITSSGGSGRLSSDERAIIDMHDRATHNRTSILSYFFMVTAVLLVISAILMPFEPLIMINVLTLLGPTFALVLYMIMLQYRIYGPMTRLTLAYGWLEFDIRTWNILVLVVLTLNVVMLPFFNSCKRIWHWYYLRSLKGNFFADGMDIPMSALKEDDCPTCPLLVLTGTVNDFVPPGNTSPIHEVFFSPLHTGGKATGYLNTPRYRTLAKCTALTGAGCLDAISLGMSAQLRFRVWLELLNLSWGDYVLFQKDDPLVESLKGMMDHVSPGVYRFLTWMRLRVPSMLLTTVFVALLAAGWMRAKLAVGEDCEGAKATVMIAVLVVILCFMASFFGFIPGLDCLAFSPLVREIHQITGFQFQGNRPPGLLYITDGGLQDCTCVVQLMRRKCPRILLALAASDPDDELAVLRTAMDIAVKEKLGCFFDPQDPRKDIRILMEEYKSNKEMPFLHLGIRYGWTDESHGEQVLAGDTSGPKGSTGELFVVKNRLPPSFEQKHFASMPPLLTEEEIITGKCENDGSAQESWGDTKPTDLGGIGCCDCCHRSGMNGGPKFPHLSGLNYLWLTPQLYANLSRLGYHASEAVIDKLKASA
jgi:hypothetical protein